jgi:hypothetical protein
MRWRQTPDDTYSVVMTGRPEQGLQGFINAPVTNSIRRSHTIRLGLGHPLRGC